jgi:nitroreductase
MSTSRRELFQLASVAAAGAAPLGAMTKEDDPASILSVFARRQTVRRYKPDPVPEAHLLQILDAARRGPTCMNQQPWTFLVIRDPAKIQAMKTRTLELVAKFVSADKKEAALHFTEGYFTAPVYVVVLVDTGCPCTGYAQRHDGPIAAGYLMIAARAFGYGTAYLTDGIPEQVTREVLAIPSQYQRICITPIGVPDHWPEPMPKRKLAEMVAYETLEGHAPLKPVPYNP